jgi:hypothetical protein
MSLARRPVALRMSSRLGHEEPARHKQQPPCAERPSRRFWAARREAGVGREPSVVQDSLSLPANRVRLLQRWSVSCTPVPVWVISGPTSRGPHRAADDRNHHQERQHRHPHAVLSLGAYGHHLSVGGSG